MTSEPHSLVLNLLLTVAGKWNKDGNIPFLEQPLQETATLPCTGPASCAAGRQVSTHLPECCLTVGGLRSPWRGEYKEPRHLLRDTCPHTPHAQLQECLPPEDDTCPAPKLQPLPLPEPLEQNESPTLNLSKEESGSWEPFSLSSLDPSLARSSSSPERRATLPELELQQLEIGRAASCTPLQSHCPALADSSRPFLRVSSCWTPPYSDLL